MVQKLPIGLQDFRGIIEDGYKYIDKTSYLYKLATTGKYYFLSRPRRFGKSITISTLKELYSGSRELFKGLWIADYWDWSQKRPVVRMSLTNIGFPSLGLNEALEQEIELRAEDYQIPLKAKGITRKFQEFIKTLATKQSKVVVLIDEYDAPILHYLGKDQQKAIENRDLLKEFYTGLKDLDEYLEFVFITGVSKFSKVGIFSGLNNLIDLTTDPEFATMLGYTQAELEKNFSEEIVLLAKNQKMKPAQLIEKMQLWYNGYKFEIQADKVYNPVSVNYFFRNKKFENFWFSTGTPTFLVNLLKNEGIFDLHFPPVNFSGFESFELDKLKPIAVLFQTGYLTIHEVNKDGLIQLGYPNKEVRDSMLEVLIEAFVGVDAEFSSALIVRLRNAFKADNLPQVIRILQEVFKGIPYFLHEKLHEKFYHAAIHLLFSYLGIRIQSEVCISDGRVDSVVETDSHVYILEYKLDENPEKALQQIKTKQYYQGYWSKSKKVIGVGVNFSSRTRNIEDWKSEEVL